jgi:predicted branched-subunit amino acid permease
MTLTEVILMSGLVFAGASQFVAADLWTADAVPVGAIIIATLIVNLRLMLMSATLRPIFAGWPAWRAALATFFVSDESWALTMGEIDKRRRRDASGDATSGTAAFLIGAGIATWVAWFGSTVIGRILGSGIDDPSRYGLDFAFTATFLALLLGSWKGRQDLVPWIVGGLVAVLVSRFVPGQWHILAGGLVGSFAGAVVETRRAADAA